MMLNTNQPMLNISWLVFNIFLAISHDLTFFFSVLE